MDCHISRHQKKPCRAKGSTVSTERSSSSRTSKWIGSVEDKPEDCEEEEEEEEDEEQEYEEYEEQEGEIRSSESAGDEKATEANDDVNDDGQEDGVGERQSNADSEGTEAKFKGWQNASQQKHKGPQKTASSSEQHTHTMVHETQVTKGYAGWAQTLEDLMEMMGSSRAVCGPKELAW
ncbi:hypothetical protein RSAG8_09906, partial [Rhizoctonia solani AG-8 WAC10335]